MRVQGLSSQTIFRFMTGISEEKHKNWWQTYHHPYDVDDYERNRALLLWYPE